MQQQKPNAEASLKNLKNNILNKKQNKGLEHDTTSCGKAELNSEKLQTVKNNKEILDVQIKNIIPNPHNINNNSNNSKVAFHSGKNF